MLTERKVMGNNISQSIDAEELFSCPVCFETPENKVFLCPNGHSFCAKCTETLKTCPQCRVTLGLALVRNFSLESILDRANITCTFKDAGCAHKMKRLELPLHKKSCFFRPVNICRRFGFTCETLSSTAEELRKHLDEDHKVEVVHSRPDNTYSLGLINFQSRPYRTITTRIRNGLQNEEFILIIGINHDSNGNDVLSCTILYLGNMSQSELYSNKNYNRTIDLWIRQDNQKIHLRTSTEVPLHFKAAENYFSIPYTRLSLNYMKSRLDPNKGNEFDFELEVKIPPNLGDIDSSNQINQNDRKSDGNQSDSPDMTNVQQSRKRRYKTRSTGKSGKKIKQK